jgi:hypothetical protein
VDDALGVRRRHAAGQLLDQPGGVARRQRLVAQPEAEAAAADVLQRHVRQDLMLAEIKHLDDVGVAQGRHRLGLDQEAPALLAIGVRARQHHLERHQALQAQVPGLVDDAHAVAAQFVANLVAGHRRPTRWRRRLRYGWYGTKRRQSVRRARHRDGRRNLVVQPVAIEIGKALAVFGRLRLIPRRLW